jgi:hypothetical protein
MTEKHDKSKIHKSHKPGGLSEKHELIENKEAAWEMAIAEDPVRSFLADHRKELSEEQQKAIEWLADELGNKALENFKKQKEYSQKIIQEKVWKILEIKNFWLDERLIEKIIKDNPEKDENSIIKDINQKLIPAFFEDYFFKIISSENLEKIIKKAEMIKRAFFQGIMDKIEVRIKPPIQLENMGIKGEDKKSYFYGLLLPYCLYIKNPSHYTIGANILKNAEKYGVEFDEIMRKVGDRLSFGHRNQEWNSVMESHNYIFDNKKLKYIKL